MANKQPSGIESLSYLAMRIKELRTQRGWSPGDLARSSGVDEKTVRNIESGHVSRPYPNTVLKLAKVLEVTTEELLSGPSKNIESTEQKRARSKYLFLPLIAVVGLSIVLLLNFSLSRAQWELTNQRHEVRSSVAGITTWQYKTPAVIHVCLEAPWSDSVLLVGLSHTTPDGGRLVALDRKTGKTLWEVSPDVNQLREVFGSDIVDSAPFGVVRVTGWDSDGDGTPEAVVNFVHGRYYPSAVCAIDANGRILGQYNLLGHVTEWNVWDLDNDGCDELILAGVNNAKAYMGAMVTVLDREHFRGSSIDSLAAPHPSIPDSALVRIVFPAYPKPFMRQMSDSRLSAHEIQISQNIEGETSISVSVGYNQHERIIVYLDRELHPLGSDITDLFRETLKSWPDSVVTNTGPADDVWRAKWLAGHRHFAAGHWPPKDSNIDLGVY